MANLDFTRKYVQNLSQTLLKDIDTLIDHATKTAQGFPMGEHPTTESPHHTLLPTLEGTPSRCTIPLATTCFIGIETFGLLINNGGYYDGDDAFNKAVINFFRYGKIEISSAQKELLRQAYRNGMIHNFLPTNEKLAISFDKWLVDKEELFIKYASKYILNVNYLSKITKEVIVQIVADSNMISQIDQNLHQFLAKEETVLDKLVINLQKEEHKKISKEREVN